MSLNADQIYGPCSICGAVALGEWPHPWKAPCPQKAMIDQAYVDMLDAQRMSYIRAGQGIGDMGDSVRRAFGDEKE